MAVTPILKTLIDNTKPPVQSNTKYKSNSAEDFKPKIQNDFQVYGNSPMKSNPIKLNPPVSITPPSPTPSVQDLSKIAIQSAQNVSGNPTLGNPAPQLGQGTIAPIDNGININNPIPGIAQVPSQIETTGEYISKTFNENISNRQPQTNGIPITQQTILDLSANIAQGDQIDVIRTKYPELNHLDDQVILDFSANLAQGDDYNTLVQKYPELNPDTANNQDDKSFIGILKNNIKEGFRFGGAVADTVIDITNDTVNTAKVPKKEITNKFQSGDYEGAVGGIIQNAIPNLISLVASGPAYLASALSDPEAVSKAFGDASEMLVTSFKEDPEGTLKKIGEYGFENPLDFILGVRAGVGAIKSTVKAGQKVYNTAKIIANNDQIPVKFTRYNPNAISTPEQIKANPQGPIGEEVHTTVGARDLLKYKAGKQVDKVVDAVKKGRNSFNNKFRREKNVINADEIDYTTTAQQVVKKGKEVVQKVKDAFKTKPTTQPQGDIGSKSILDTVQPSKKDIKNGQRKGIDPIVIATVKARPGLFKQIQSGEITGETVMDRVTQFRDNRLSETSDIGKTYEAMYDTEYKFDGGSIYDNTMSKLNELGVKVEDGKIDVNTLEYVLDTGEKSKITEAVGNIIRLQGKELGVKELHTLRKNIDKLSKWSDGFDKKNSRALGEIRGMIDESLKKEVGGWSTLDEMYKANKDSDKVILEFFDKKGNFKGDPKTLLTDRNKNKLDTLDKMIPGIKDEIIMLAMHKSYTTSKNTNKPGAYRKSMIKQVASTLGGVAGVSTGTSTVSSILMGFAGSYVGEKIGGRLGDPEAFMNKITSTNEGKSLIDDIELGKELSAEDKATLERIVKEAIKSGRKQSRARRMKKVKEENIKKDIKKSIDDLTLKKSRGLPQRTTTNIGTKENPIKVSDRRSNEQINAVAKKKEEFVKNAKPVILDNFTSDKAYNGILYNEDGVKVKNIISKSSTPYNPIQAVLTDGRTIDLVKNPKSLFEMENKRGIPGQKKKVTPVSMVEEINNNKELLPWDEGYEAIIKTADNEMLDISKMSDDEFLKYQEKSDFSKADEYKIQDEIFRRANVGIKDKYMEDDIAIENMIKIADSKQSRVGKVGNNKVNRDYAKTQDKEAQKDIDKIVEYISESKNVGADEAYDIYLNIQNRYKYQQTVREQSTVSPEVARNTIMKYFDEDEINVNFLDSITTPSGQQAFGRYYNKTIDMINNPHKTTADHESAHAYFDMFTSKSDKENILNQIKKEQNITDDLEAEEFLADGFSDYVSGKKKMTYGQKIKDFFQKIWEQIKKFFGQEDKVKKFYNDIMNKKRDKFNKSNPIQYKDMKYETFGETEKYTIQPILDIRKEIRSDTVKKSTIENMINRQGYKAPEKQALQDIIDNMDGDTISKEELIDGLKQSIMPLEEVYTDNYSDFNKLYFPKNPKTIILESPFITGVGNHFNNKNYFSHVRIEGEGKNKTLMELQSDLMQSEEKKRSIKSKVIGFNKKEIIKQLDEINNEVREGKKMSDIVMKNINYFINDDGSIKEIRINELHKELNYDNTNGIFTEYMDEVNETIRNNIIIVDTPIGKYIGDYKNEGRMRRTLDETVKNLARDGVETLKIPYGTTIAQIEGHAGSTTRLDTADALWLSGIIANSEPIENMMIETFSDALGSEREEMSNHGKRIELNKGKQQYIKDLMGYDIKENKIIDPALFEETIDRIDDEIPEMLYKKIKDTLNTKSDVNYTSPEDRKEFIKSLSQETFKTVANFYENQLVPYTKKRYPNGKDVEYEGGIRHEIDISGEANKPLKVYQTKDSISEEYTDIDRMISQALQQQPNTRFTPGQSLAGVQDFLINKYPDLEEHINDKIMDAVMDKGINEKIEKQEGPYKKENMDRDRKYREKAEGDTSAEKLIDLTITDDFILSHPHFESYKNVGAKITKDDIKEYYDLFFKRVSKNDNQDIDFNMFKEDLDNSRRRGYITQGDIDKYETLLEIRSENKDKIISNKRKGIPGRKRK